VSFATQLKSRRVHIFGCQEARPYEEGITMCGPYIVIATSSTKHHSHGCELWIATHLPFATDVDGRKLYLTIDDIEKVHSEPTLLICSIRHMALDCVINVAHAPHEDTGADIVLPWWARYRAKVCTTAGGRPTMSFVDCNLDPDGHRQGPFRRNKHPYKFVEELSKFQTECDVSTPFREATYLAKHPKATRYTYVVPQKEASIDYIFTSAKVAVMPNSAECWPHFNMHHSHDRPDHIPIAIRATVTGAARAPAQKRRVPKYDRRRAAKGLPEDIATMQCILTNPPLVPAHVDASSHQSIMDDFYEDALVTVYPPVRRPPKPDIFAPDTVYELEALAKFRARERSWSKKAHAPIQFVIHVWTLVHREAKAGFPVIQLKADEVMIFDDPARGSFAKRECINAAIMYGAVVDFVAKVEALMDRDLAAVMEQKKQAILVAACSGDTKWLHKELNRIKKLKSWKPRQLPAIYDEHGELLTDLTATRKRWRRWFSELLCAYQTTMQHLVDLDRADKDERRELLAGIKRDDRYIYDCLDLARKNQSANPGKAICEARVGNELLKHIPH